MAIIPVKEVSDTTVPVTSPLTSPLRDVITTIAPVYRDNPGWFTQTPAGQASTLLRYAFDNLFKGRPAGLPPAPVLPFVGGQCACDSYDVRIRTDTLDASGNVVSQNFSTRRLPGGIGGLTFRNEPTPTQPDYVRWYINYNMGCGTQGTLQSFTSSGQLSNIRDTLVSVVKVSGSDTCGNPPLSDLPSPISPTLNVNVNIPDIRFSPSATVVIPVAIFRPVFNFSPNLNFALRINLGGLTINFDGDTFSTPSDNTSLSDTITTNINSNTNTQVNNSITSINNSTNTSVTNARTAINSNTNTSVTNAQTAINSNTNTSVTNAQTSINSNTSTSITNAQTAINTFTNNSLVTLRADINTAINASGSSILLQIAALANLVGLVSADLKLALQLINQINSKPDCLAPSLPPDQIPTPPDQKPPDSGGDSPPKKKLAYVEVILTKLPHKVQFGNRSAQNVYFGGWIAFRSATGSFYERQQINFRQSIFAAPAGSDGYTYTLTHGAEGTIKEYYV